MSREERKDVSFSDLGISSGLLGRLKDLGFNHPTPIQFKAIPPALNGEDVIGIAQTGSGKTLSFAIPVLEYVLKTKKKGLIILPTRELAVQVEENVRKIVGGSNLRTAILIGGTNPYPQIKQLKNNPHIVVATPGRLIDHMDQGYLKLGDMGIFVLDEADRMLDMGFAPQLNRIADELPDERQTMLFSATMPDDISNLAHRYMREPVRIEVSRPGTTAKEIDQEIFIVPQKDKFDLLEKLLKEYQGSVLVFSRTKYGAKNLSGKLRKHGIRAEEMHSNRSQNQRQKALQAFSKGRVRVLVATDIAARGIDVDDIKLVVNYDLPDQLDDYVHRIGRTGRAGKEGKAISFAAPDEKGDVARIQALINVQLPITSPEGEELPSIKPSTSATKKKRGGGGRGRGGFGGGRGRGGRSPGGDRRSGGNRREGGRSNDRKSFGRSSERGGSSGRSSEGRSFGGDRRRSGERSSEGRSYGGNRGRSSESRGSYGGDRRRSSEGGRSNRSEGGKRHGSSDRRSGGFGDRGRSSGRSSGGDRRSGGSRNGRSGGNSFGRSSGGRGRSNDRNPSVRRSSR